MIPVAISMKLVPSAAADPRRTRICTDRAEIHGEGEGESPEIYGLY